MKEIKCFSWICSHLFYQAELYRERKRILALKKLGFDVDLISKNVQMQHIENIKIGKGTYFNSGQIHAGPNSKIIIGNYCAIGYNVHIKSYTHSVRKPTGIEIEMKDKDIFIGDNTWICDNVYIKEGITIGNNVIIGANSVVTKNIDDFSVVGGCPAKELYNLK